MSSAKKIHQSHAFQSSSGQSMRGGKKKYGSRFTGGTSLLSSTRKKSVSSGMSPSERFSLPRIPIQVFDEAGVNVTPLPFGITDVSTAHTTGVPIPEGSLYSPTDVLSQWSSDTSAFGGGPFTRSVFTHSGTIESVAEEETVAHLSTWADIRQERAEIKEVLTESDLDKMIILTLKETDTIWMLNTPTVCVAEDSPDAEDVILDNSIYSKLCKSRIGNDLYTERGMNTFNDAPKVKGCQTTKIGYADADVTCTHWTMYDAFQDIETEAKEQDQKKEEEDLITHLEKSVDTVVEHKKHSHPHQQYISGSPKLSSAGCSVASMSHESTVIFGEGTKESSATTAPSDASSLNETRIMKSESLKKDLFVMERIINLNSYQPKQALYRGLSIVQDIDQQNNLSQITDNDMGPNLDRLWAYVCPLTKGHNVSCLAWNKVNPDLLAVGYGQFEFTAQKSGLICCWCLKNPEYPERIYTSKHGVMSLDFSHEHPHILAAGFYDGGVAIYNVRSPTDEALLDSQRDCHSSLGSGDAAGEMDMHNRHLGPVWQLQWVHRDTAEEKAEVMISISTDGHVTQWNIRKGFECYAMHPEGHRAMHHADIMLLKKTPTRMAGQPKEKQGEAIISRYAGGLCFDFEQGDSNLYLAGTEEGYIHKCSCSYNEQYLETYTAHTGPVYKVRWSPFVSNVFLSCSADWSICLWHDDQNNPVQTFHSSTKAVHDLCWSPRCSTVFACVNEGAVEVWDLTQSILDAVITVTPTYGAKLTSVTFAKNTECILVGDSEGMVTVYELRCMPPILPAEFQEDNLKDIIEILRHGQLTSVEKHPRTVQPVLEDSSSTHTLSLQEII